MEVLVIDDQMNVIEGIRQGVDWERLGITKVYEATNIQDAEKIIETNKLQIMVCDIEMPMGNGIELLHWVRDKKYPMECIFLTAYAKFEYANEAIKLNAFDYVLQPVKYEELTRVLQNVIEKIKQENDRKELTAAGTLYRKNNAVYTGSVLKSILDGNSDWIEYYLTDQYVQSKGISASSKYLPIYLSILRIENYEIASARKSLLSCLQEQAQQVYKENWKDMLLINMASNKYLLLYAPAEETEMQKIGKETKQLIEECQEQGVIMAAYRGETSTIHSLSATFARLKRMDEKNVGGYSNLFWGEENADIENRPARLNWKRYAILLEGKHYDLVRTELLRWIHDQLAAQKVTEMLLYEFIQEFIRMIYGTQKELGVQLDFLLHETRGHMLYADATHSVESTLLFVDYVMDGLKKGIEEENHQESIVEQVCDYIDRNIEQDITRNEIAEAVHMNPEYLSKMFKKEKGIGLSNYITEEKMKRAKSYLENTQLPICVIASKLGYSNFSYFSKIFKNSTGALPNDYRRENP